MMRMGRWPVRPASPVLAWQPQAQPSQAGGGGSGSRPENSVLQEECFPGPLAVTFPMLVLTGLLPYGNPHVSLLTGPAGPAPPGRHASGHDDDTGVPLPSGTRTSPSVCCLSLSPAKGTLLLSPVFSGTLCYEVITYLAFLESQKIF